MRTNTECCLMTAENFGRTSGDVLLGKKRISRKTQGLHLGSHARGRVDDGRSEPKDDFGSMTVNSTTSASGWTRSKGGLTRRTLPRARCRLGLSLLLRPLPTPLLLDNDLDREVDPSIVRIHTDDAVSNKSVIECVEELFS